MSSTYNSSWTWNPSLKPWVRYDSRTDKWIEENGVRATPPGGTTRGDSRSEHGAIGQQSHLREHPESNADAILAASLERVHLQGKQPEMAGTRDFVAEDSRSGTRTHWTISPTQHYTDPNTAQRRLVTVKHIRRGSDEDGRKAKLTSRDKMVNSKPGRAIGKVVEVRIVAPDPTRISAASVMISDVLGGESNRARTRRFVVVQERPDGRDCFRAIAIKTYNGEGVIQQIKFHHSQIFSGRQIPAILPGERPGVRAGQMERPMQSQAIRVVPYDRVRMLDPMSRLDYCDSTDFDYEDPQVRVFGRVHEDSEAALVTQWQSVMSAVIASIRGPVPSRSTDIAFAQRGSTQGTGHVPGGSAIVAAAGPSEAPNRAPDALTTGSASSERVTIRDVNRLIRHYRDYAEENDLTWPARFTQAGLEQMTESRQLRETVVRRIRDNLNTQLKIKSTGSASITPPGSELMAENRE